MVIDPSTRTFTRLGRLVGDGTEQVSDADLLRRYVNTRDGAAFAALVRRHGPMVFGVSRRTLGRVHDAEDAFQATFLILARKARGVRPDEVSRWLYGVAVRVANKARVRRARRSGLPADLNDIPAPPATAAADWLPLLDAALSRLPERDRWPILLCDLQGLSRAEAAAELGIAEGTLSSRLARARAKLRSKLVHRGVVPTVAVAAALQTDAVPAALIESTLAVGAPAAARQLAEGVVRSMFFAKLTKLVVSTTCVLGAVTIGVVAVPGAGADPIRVSKSAAKEKEPPSKAKEDPKPKSSALPDAERIQGTWVVVEVLRHADQDDAKKLIGQSITFDKGRLTTPWFLGQSKTYKLDPGWDPKRLDLILRNLLSSDSTLFEAIADVPKEITVPAIYRFDGERLHLVIGSSSRKVRPESFDAKDSVFTHVVLRRRPDAVRDDPTRDERKRLEGTWESIAVEGRGVRQTHTDLKLVFQGNRLLTHSSAQGTPREFEYTVDPKLSPRHIDVTAIADSDLLKKGQILKGLYTLDGDLLTLTFGNSSDERPKTLIGTNHPTMYYRRAGTNPKLPHSGVTPRLRELLQERINSLKVIADAIDQGLMLGKGNVLEAVRADEDVAAAELELATTVDEKAKVLERLVQRLKKHETNAIYHVTGGTLANADQARVKAARLKAEIELERLKAGK